MFLLLAAPHTFERMRVSMELPTEISNLYETAKYFANKRYRQERKSLQCQGESQSVLWNFFFFFWRDAQKQPGSASKYCLIWRPHKAHMTFNHAIDSVRSNVRQHEPDEIDVCAVSWNKSHFAQLHWALPSGPVCLSRNEWIAKLKQRTIYPSKDCRRCYWLLAVVSSRCVHRFIGVANNGISLNWSWNSIRPTTPVWLWVCGEDR